jgi:ferredoxin-NADP reductase
MDLEKQSFPKPVFLFYSNRYKKAAAYDEQLQAIDLMHYNYAPVITSQEPKINGEFLKSKLSTPYLANFDYYVVGSSRFLHSMGTLLLENEVNRSQIVIDDFG